METAIWSQPFNTGEKNMSHTVTNLEHHHFKYPAPTGARATRTDLYSLARMPSVSATGMELKDGDVMEIEIEWFWRALRNPIRD